MASKHPKFQSELERRYRRRVDEIESSGNYNSYSRNNHNTRNNVWKSFHSNYNPNDFFVDSEDYGYEGDDTQNQKSYKG